MALKVACTCRQEARSARAYNVHHSESNHFFVSINMVVLDCGKTSSNSYSFLYNHHHSRAIENVKFF